ncbi:MAG TPA: hypothetical protein ENK16_04805 [Chromatiales bacterium]|nr:hypothetical protein [Chromatiales bacterium]
MDDRKRSRPTPDSGYEGLEEATAGWDPYISSLLNEPENPVQTERRRVPRDKTPARRRTMLAAGRDSQESE